MEKQNFLTRVLIYQGDDKIWYAHSLEFDIVGDGVNPKEAKDNLIDLLNAQIKFAIENNLEKNLYHPAPKKFLDMYNALEKQGIFEEFEIPEGYPITLLEKDYRGLAYAY